MSASPLVLLVDASPDSRAVLRTLLEHEGTKTIESARLDDAAQVAQRETPDLIVYDADGERLSNASRNGKMGKLAQGKTVAWDSLEAWSSLTATPIVVLGTNRADQGGDQGDEFVRKPYHYRALLHKIQDKLADRRAA